MSLTKAVLLLGSNLGDKEENLRRAVSEIKASIGIVLSETAVLDSEPVEYESDSQFCNLALIVQTDLGPMKLLEAVKKIEVLHGRSSDTRQTLTYTDRIIDIDIVKFGNIIFESERLTIPHRKHLYERAFSSELLKSLDNFTNY